MRSRMVIVAFVFALVMALVSVVPASASNASAACGPNVTHLIRRGETLFRIARNYGTTINAIAAANNIANINRIYWGTTLRIPCPGQVVRGVPVPPPHTIFHPAFCATLRGTSPLGGMAFGQNRFYWDPVAGATSYRVNVYNLDVTPNRLVGSWTAAAPATSLVGDVGGAAGHGFYFAWEV
jgi:LysM repeat protein